MKVSTDHISPFHLKLLEAFLSDDKSLKDKSLREIMTENIETTKKVQEFAKKKLNY